MTLAPGATGTPKKLPPPGGALSRTNATPMPTSTAITGARWLTGRYDPPGNQWGDILLTVWSDDGSTYVLMDDGGTDVPVSVTRTGSCARARVSATTLPSYDVTT